MKGKVRSRETHCEKCGKRFTIKEYIAIWCKDCLTRPETYYVFLYWRGKKYKIERNQDRKKLRSYKDALDLLEDINNDMAKGLFIIEHYLAKESEEFRCKNLLKKWRAAKAHLAPTTLREMDRYIEKYYTPFFGEKMGMQIASADVEDFLLQLPAGLSPKTKKNVMERLQNFCGWLRRRETLARMPVFPEISVPEPAIEVISRDAMTAAIGKLDPHHQPIFRFMMLHPVRTGEARALKVKDFDQSIMVVHIERAFSLKEIRTRKNRKDYYLPVHREFDVAAALRNKLPEAWVFTNKAGQPYTSEGLRKLWHKARVKAEIPNIKLYNATRHSFATGALRDGHSLESISKALGHSDRKMVERYAKHSVELLRGMFGGSGMVPKQEASSE